MTSANQPDPLRIAHVTAAFPPYWSGMSNVAYFNALEVARLGHEVHVFTAQHPLNDYRDPEEIHVHRLWTPFRVGNAPLTPGLLTALRRFDLIHLHWPYIFGAELTWAASLLLRVPYVMTYHLDLRAERRWVFGLYQRFWGPVLARSAGKILAVTTAHLRSSRVYPTLRMRQQKIVEVPNGVDTTLFNRTASGVGVRVQYGIPPHHRVIVFVGALDSAHEYKGVPDLLEAFGQLDDPDTWLLLVGGGDLVPEYRALTARLPQRLQRRIVFAGTIPYPQLPAYYVAADVAVLPSREPESFGMVLIEALACGTPVIASAAPGVQAVIDHGVDGLLFNARDVAALAARLKSLLQDPAQRRAMGARGRAKVEARYAWPAILPRLVAVYEEVLADGPRPA